MSIGEKRNTGKCTEGDKAGEDAETVETWEIVNSHSLMNYESSKCTSYNHHKSVSASVYVAFRHSHPDKATVEEVLKVMQDNNIDVSQLVELSADHCRQA